MFKSYVIDKGKIEKLTFFKSLAKYFPDATTFYGGGSGLPVDVRAIYETHEPRYQELAWVEYEQDILRTSSSEN